MGATPNIKVYTPTGEYVAAFKYYEDAAALVALRGAGTTIRSGHAASWTLWTEGTDGNAADSYDAVAERCEATLRKLQEAAYDKRYGSGAARAAMEKEGA